MLQSNITLPSLYTTHNLWWILHPFTPFLTCKNLITEWISQLGSIISVDAIFWTLVIWSHWNFYHWLMATSSSFSHDDEHASVIRCGGENVKRYLLDDSWKMSSFIFSIIFSKNKKNQFLIIIFCITVQICIFY